MHRCRERKMYAYIYIYMSYVLSKYCVFDTVIVVSELDACGFICALMYRSTGAQDMMCICVCVCIYVYVYIYIYMYMYVYVYIYIYMYVYMYVYIYIHIHTHAKTPKTKVLNLGRRRPFRLLVPRLPRPRLSVF